MPRQVPIPQAVIDKDHDLDGRSSRSTEALAKHRWHQTLDPDGPQFPIRAYARAVGLTEQTIRRYARGWALFVERQGASVRLRLTIHDAVLLANQSAEEQAITEAIAEGSGRSVAQVETSSGRHRRNEIATRARVRAERRGTSPADEARAIAAAETRAAASRRTQDTERRQRHSIMFIHVDGAVAKARRHLTEALNEAHGVGFTDEEVELLRHSVAEAKAVIDLLTVRFGGSPDDVDWDAELARLSGGAA